MMNKYSPKNSQCLFALRQTLLPKGCCRAAYITKDYKEWELCNFIGMLLQPLFPDDIVKPCVVMDISGVRHVDHVDSPQIASEQTSPKLDAEVEELKRRYYLITPTNIENLPTKGRFLRSTF